MSTYVYLKKYLRIFIDTVINCFSPKLREVQICTNNRCGKLFLIKLHSEIGNTSEMDQLLHVIACNTGYISQSSQLRYGFSRILLLACSAQSASQGCCDGIDEEGDGVVWDRGTEGNGRMLATLPSLIAVQQLCC